MHELSVGRFVCTLMFLTGCALFQDEEVIYLNAAKENHATQADIKRRFGAPKFSGSLSNGESVWRYEIWTTTVGDLNGPGRSYCDQYDLRFDKNDILRDWTHRTC